MIREIILHGPLAEKYGKEPLVFSADNVQQLMRALEIFCKGFKKELRKYSHIAVVKEKDKRLDCLTPNEYNINFGTADKIHVVADVTAAGAATFAAAIAEYGTFTYYAAYAIYTVALMYVMGQVIQGMQDTIGTEQGKPDNKSSLFNGPENRSLQGARVQLNYGIFRVGSVTVNQEMTGVRQAITKSDNISLVVNTTTTLNIFSNDTYTIAPTVTNFTVNGVTTTAGGTNTSITGVSITITAAGLVTVVDTSGTPQTITVTIVATDSGQTINQNLQIDITNVPEDYWAGGGGGGGDAPDGGGGPGGDDGGGAM